MKNIMFTPDYRHLVEAANNRRPQRLPLYEHLINPPVMERVLGVSFAGELEGDTADLRHFFECYCRFYREMTYDTVSFEAGIAEMLPGHGAIYGGRPGPIQNREDFLKYPWGGLAGMYWRKYDGWFRELGRAMPEGMRGVGGVGYGVFEISEDLVGFENLSYLQADDPDTFASLYEAIGDLMVEIWTGFLERHGDLYAVCRFGDDLGYKSGLLSSPDMLRRHVIPQYKRIIEVIHAAGKPVLWHSCGCIFEVMEDVIAAGIDAKHSNEDVIAPYDEWIRRYSGRIGLFGGIDTDVLCREKPEEIKRRVVEDGRRFRRNAHGYALGSGNSIPEYVPTEGYLALIEAAKILREEERG